MKLYIHPKSFSEELVVINPNDFPSIKIGDFLEIYHPDGKESHLLLQVKTLNVELPQKGVVSVEQGVANLFQLRAYQSVTVQRVEPDNQDVALDLVELVFKDQYISRSNMWRLRSSLVKSCLHISQKVEMCGVRAQVQELWSHGGTVSCGIVTADTRVAFRSSTAMVYLFIQMSSEMWDFDTCGDLYIEKAVNGFLIELFTKWKEKNSNHELSIVLFSRTYFEADSIDEFPPDMRPRLHMHEDGRFYEDYFRVFAQNERREDWLQVLPSLKATIKSYAKDIRDWQRRAGCLLKGLNSNSCQGNVLEAINLSLNVFDNHYMNRNFDRTGQLVVMVTPGAGVFEVDRTLCKLTEQRMIDYGIGSDVVCLAEQPLHPVPLLKFRDALNTNGPYKDRYNIPHWLNYSFYLSPSQKRRYQSTQTSFISRLRLPDRTDEGRAKSTRRNSTLPHVPWSSRIHSDSSRSTLSSEDSVNLNNSDIIDQGTTNILDNNNGYEDDDDEKFERHDRKLFHPGRRRGASLQSQNNPFCPDTLAVVLTADRRRWTHVFPHGPDGEMIQLHHRQLVKIPSQENVTYPSPRLTPSASSSPSPGPSPVVGQGLSQYSIGANSDSTLTALDHSHPWWVRGDRRRRLGCVWGITGEQAWTPFLQSGMDWKSMATTACFPTTTDFYPEKKSLEQDYQEAPYAIVVEGDTEQTSNLNTVFMELISQRLIQDFQMVILPQQELAGATALRSRLDQPMVTDPSKNVYVLSYASAFHKLSLKPDSDCIEVVLYTHRKSSQFPKFAYTYSLWPLYKDTYELSHTRMYHKPVENSRWNYRDSYISFGGMASREGFELQECVKFWRSRFVLLPSHSTLLRQMAETGYHGNLDLFDCHKASSKHHLVEGFLRFLEGLNRRRARRKVPSGGMKSQRYSQADLAQSANSPGLRKIPHSGSSTPISHNATFNLASTSISSLLSGIVTNRKDELLSVEQGEGADSPEKNSREGHPNLGCGYAQVVKAMKDPSSGINFIGGDQRGLPTDSFTSAEAVSWIRKSFDDSPTHAQAISLLQGMLSEGHMFSVFSDSAAKQICYGYYIYCLPDMPPDSSRSDGRYIVGQAVFEDPPQQEWFEAVCTFPRDSPPTVDSDGAGVCMLPIYKNIVMEMWNADLGQTEYCHASFHGNYQPNHAFDMELQWLTSTPGLLNDLIMNWLRRAQSAGFHLVPSHVDPFCFWEDISDPLCSPLFIPLTLPQGCALISDKERLVNLQDLILNRFGFLANHTSCMSPLLGSSDNTSPYSDIHVQYIHVTGAVFALPTPTQADMTSPRRERLPCLCSTWREADSHCHHHGNNNQMSYKRQLPSQRGFLWVNNHLLTKKWRSSASGDDMFRDALYQDFVALCSNNDGRLEKLITFEMVKGKI